MIAGIAGINPKHGTIGAVTFAKYAVQVALQSEIDAREMPADFPTGYFPQSSFTPDQYPRDVYGTEVFEVNEALRDIAVAFASNVTLNDSSIAQVYRSKYTEPEATKAPGILTCDVATSDVYFSGRLLGEAFENTTTLFTNGSGVYCTTAQEDNATLEVLLRAAIRGTVDFARIIIMRSASDFDRPPTGMAVIDNLMYADPGSFRSSVENLYIAGNPIVQGIIAGWDAQFKKGIKPTNYIGDIFGTLGGEPDFGLGSVFGGVGYKANSQPKKRILSRRDAYKSARVMWDG
jgi:purine nucleoside permease